jgi:small subunit ribosomal protein S17
MAENENTPENATTNEETVEATAEETVATTPEETAADAVSAAPTSTEPVETAAEPTDAASHGRRQEKVGLVTSNKMTKTVVVRVERQVRHPKYKRYIRRRKKFMAHDDLGVNIGDIVKIIETRPLSARKRWRVVEIVQKAN